MNPIITALAQDAIEGVLDLPQDVMFHLLQMVGQPLWLSHFIWWFLAGLLGTLIYRFNAQGPASPFGGQEEQETFWLILFSGYVGFVMAVYSAFYVRRVCKQRLHITTRRLRWSRFR